jgi:8-oxo-dGTP pyrophosphatase MutT (NUDIX family)
MQVQIAIARNIPTKTRFQSGCIPYRDVDGVRQVLLVKKLKKGAWWGFTKGGVEKGITKKENAAKECMEEAGVYGKVTKKLGQFTYIKDSAFQIVDMYAMEFREEAEHWDEKTVRKRKWFTLAEARDKLSREHHNFLTEIRKLA